MRFYINNYAIAAYMILKFSTAQVFEGIKETTYPPFEVFGGSPLTRFRWAEQSDEIGRGLCLIDWSPPNSTFQPVGTRGCVERGAPHDMGEQWVLSTKYNEAKTDNATNFEGLIGNTGTGRCLEWKPALANALPHTSVYPATTYGNLTSEVCDRNNQYQYFKLNDWRNPNSTINFLPRMWNETCPEGQQPTIIAGPKRSLIVYGCGKGLWKSDPIVAEIGWWYYDAIEYQMYRIELNSDRYQTILCCQREMPLADSYCREAMRKEGQGDRTPDVFWTEMCTALFPNYPEFQKKRMAKQNL
ncbi:hypothetical protein TWF102_009907 [Orbilia oligospora]|uniref:Uncharacterized protein n=1 Tax=Orbilia oligospora TaxID=2813651 RepID=A0A7C8JEZ3_ORBOL|nr:hypothetical protein TWF103_002268 [Orbilia oligospora]KAF3092686.1 hypothetical protein TWF706_008988 [Orbilia oligospora]KAF3109130.1 hypothetical protein TWF102_009907 [Orbilia oligospora]KAF3152952.1 hypothetical protein TWF594_000008 [Orbilia oligospora]